MKINLLSCDAQRPDRRAISKCIVEISTNIDESLSRELTDKTIHKYKKQHLFG